jgi:hypothetical protein
MTNGTDFNVNIILDGESVLALEQDWPRRLHSWRMQEDEDYFYVQQAAREHYEEHVPYEKWSR